MVYKAGLLTIGPLWHKTCIVILSWQLWLDCIKQETDSYLYNHFYFLMFDLNQACHQSVLRGGADFMSQEPQVRIFTLKLVHIIFSEESNDFLWGGGLLQVCKECDLNTSWNFLRWYLLMGKCLILSLNI